MITKQNFVRFFVISALGIFLHFAYDLSGQNPTVGLFSAVNESSWEHLKLLFFPMLFVTLYELFRNKEIPPNFLPARTAGILGGMLFILVVFYTIWGVFGVLIDFINILIYFCAVIFALWLEHHILTKGCTFQLLTAIITLFALTISFFIFTSFPPKLGLFFDLSLHPKTLP
ncbi:MAG: DUF6512 family protein [Eubacteriales bacterium]|nr:DUF6512 family protein [Eubacteriales bacterium]